MNGGPRARNFVAAMALSLDPDELSGLTGSGNGERNERIRTAFYTWAQDNAESELSLEDAWHTFIAGFIPVSVNNMKEVLNPVDIKRYNEFFDDLRQSDSIPVTTTPYTLTLVLDPDGAFKGAWYSCNDTQSSSYFFLWVDIDWAWEKLASMADVLANAFRAANAPQIRKKSYSFADTYHLVYEHVHYKPRS